MSAPVDEPVVAAQPLALLLRVNALSTWRRLKGLRQQSRLLMAVISVFIAGYLAIAFWLFLVGLRFIAKFPGLGSMLMERLLFLLFAFLFILLLISVGTAYLVMQFASIMDYVQALFSFFIAPLFGTVILVMLWKRTSSAGGFWGLLCGTVSSIGMWTWVKIDPTALRYVALSPNAKALAQDMYQALWSFVVCVIVTVVVSLMTKPKADSELTGLVYGLTEVPSIGNLPLYQKPVFWAAVVAVALVILNIIMW